MSRLDLGGAWARWMHTRSFRWVNGVFWAAVVGVAAAAVGRTAALQPTLALMTAGIVFVLGISALEPAAVPLVVTPLVLVSYRLDVVGLDLSVSDVALGVGTLIALVLAPRPFTPQLRRLLWLNAAYQFATLFAVISNPFSANVVEWIHAWMLISGSLLVGWTVARRGLAQAGLSMLIVAGIILALVTIGQGLQQFMVGDFGAVYVRWPYGMHKNFVGSMLAFVALVAYVNPRWLGWSRAWALGAFGLLSAALAFTQSRQAIVGLGVALVFMVARTVIDRRRSRLILFVVVPALLFALTLVHDQIEEGNQFNSFFQRLDWFSETIAFWRESAWFGHGLRFWYQDGSVIAYQPPNALLEVLASSGVVGLGAFVVFTVGVLVVLWRLDPRFGMLGLAVMVARVVQSQFDLYWVFGQSSLPFLIAGVCLGVAARADSQALDPRSLLDLDESSGIVPSERAR